MIIHSYFTNGFFDWSKLFIESFAYFNGTDHKIILDTRDLKENQVKELENLYPDIKIRNLKLNWDELEKISDTSKKELEDYKWKIENKKVNEDIKIWKLLISGDYRVKALNSLINELSEGENLVHFDIDTYIDGDLSKMFDFVKDHDFCVRFRTKRPPKDVFKENKAVQNGVMGFTVNDKTREFMKKWISHIDNVPPLERHKGFGQTSCYYAYLNMCNNKDFKVGELYELKNWKDANKGYKNKSLIKYREIFENTKKKNN